MLGIQKILRKESVRFYGQSPQDKRDKVESERQVSLQVIEVRNTYLAHENNRGTENVPREIALPLPSRE